MSDIRIRPHHALCAQFFEGKGYSPRFVEHMTATLAHLEQANPLVTLTSDCDIICTECPHNKGECATDDKVSAIDERTLRVAGLQYGQTLSWGTLVSLTRDKIIDEGKLKDVCRDCQWIGICTKQAYRCEDVQKKRG